MARTRHKQKTLRQPLPEWRVEGVKQHFHTRKSLIHWLKARRDSAIIIRPGGVKEHWTHPELH